MCGAIVGTHTEDLHMFEEHHQRYLERIWKAQESDVGKRQEPWFYMVLAGCAVCMLYDPMPGWQMAEMGKLIAIIYVLLTTLSTSIMWLMASPSRVQTWELEQVFHRSFVEMALEPSWRDSLRYLVILGVAAGFWNMGSIWAGAVALIWLVMKFELKHRWKMIITHRIREIPNH